VQQFDGKAFVVRVDEPSAHTPRSTLIDDLTFLCERGVRPIVIGPNPTAAQALVRAINRSGNVAVSLSGADAAMLPSSGRGIGKVQIGILQTLTSAGYIPVVEPTAFSMFGDDVEIVADDVAAAIASATDAVRAIFFHALGGIPDPQTASLINELTPAEALAIAQSEHFPDDLRRALRAAALGVRGGVAAAQILDGRVAHASIVEYLTTHHLGTQVTGSIFTGGSL
jgi:acetylglutamate kinase